jgi:hypothetical protein
MIRFLLKCSDNKIKMMIYFYIHNKDYIYKDEVLDYISEYE